ncbi:MAG: PEGA domain-containing protein, partial [Bryobacterales bacterium]|nr:PEGA domain-containing protein [Bryobacterales bacterium]
MRLWVLVLAVSCSFLASAADKSGAIKARVKPGRAGVWIDGKYVGPAVRFSVPEKYSVDAGDHEVVLRDPRYED